MKNKTLLKDRTAMNVGDVSSASLSQPTSSIVLLDRQPKLWHNTGEISSRSPSFQGRHPTLVVVIMIVIAIRDGWSKRHSLKTKNCSKECSTNPLSVKHVYMSDTNCLLVQYAFSFVSLNVYLIEVFRTQQKVYMQFICIASYCRFVLYKRQNCLKSITLYNECVQIVPDLTVIKSYVGKTCNLY